jgi:predicted permease
MKLVVFPALAWIVVWSLGAPPLLLQVAVLETAMPTMITAGALMMAYGIASELAAALVSWGLCASLVTLPLWAMLLKRV